MNRQRARVLAIVLTSVALLIPCFWHGEIEAGDLASHTYNAWLATLVRQGRAPGLWIASQHNNVLFDILLQRLCSLFGFVVGEKIAVGLSVLLFFWAAFALAREVSDNDPWFLTPLLAGLTYGWTVEMGFFNFYLSLGFSFLGLAIIWNARGMRWLYVLPLIPIIWLAHPLGFFWFVATALYVTVARRLPTRGQWIFASMIVVVVFVLRWFLESRFQVLWPQMHWYRLNGADQLVLGWRYRFFPWYLIAVIAICLAVQWRTKSVTQGRDDLRWNSIALQLFVIALIAVMFLPDGLVLPRYADPVLFIDLRFTLALAVLGCCALGGLSNRPRWLFGIATALSSLVFFVFLFFDSGHIYAMELQAKRLMRTVPPGGRVISTLFPLGGSRLFSHQVTARACIGRCFVIDNYEAATGQFRLRASAGNKIVESDPRITNAMMSGDYEVQPEDLPLWEIFQCGPSEVDLCLGQLKPGPLWHPAKP